LETGTVVALHGVGGNHTSSYIQHFFEVMSPSFRCVAVNLRGASPLFPLLTPKAYCAGSSDDFKIAVEYIHKLLPHSPLFLLGYSMGANVVVKYLGEEGEKAKGVGVRGGMAISNPFSVWVAMDETRFSIRHVYRHAILYNAKSYIKRNREVLEQHSGINIDKLMKATTAREIDEYGTLPIVGPIYGYETVEEYRYKSSSIHTLSSVKVPLLCLNAEDDPLCPRECIPANHELKNEHVILATTKKGSHLAWLQLSIYPLDKSWANLVAVDYFTSLLALPTSTTTPNKAPTLSAMLKAEVNILSRHNAS